TALIDEDDDQGGEAPTVIMPEDSVSDIGAQTAPTVIAGDDGAVTAISGDHSVNTEYKTFTAISDIQSVNAEDEAITAISGDADETALIEPPTEDTAMDSANPAAIDAAAQAKGGTGGKSQPREIKPGMVLKDRFELLSKLGEGGMGVVYKAVDQLKVEAKDRNPYLAIKLLTGDFQSHPESFIALQRESSKAQKLAHPNIATVYDFDRDRGTPYLTMELLEGDGLNVFIKRKIPVGGLPEEEAMQLVEELAAGLSYAHEHNLVHSDLKPGNCWLTNDGHAKLLDFGIARASKTRADATGETTVFDPGQLGALTPAYATVEMFDGQDPDPRDDLYAMACIAYELFTGK
ncbi:MAG: serine/threonine protein kinase, partial [Gammaproteobacteria bacterium]|nr:serine/threonine protein kinase [Gammaproteobacteria bacterium]